MTLICDTTQATAAHALVVGVGRYPWLTGGDKPTFAHATGMGQLTSAPVSARRFALWFLEKFSHPDVTAKSLDVLISDAESDKLTESSGVEHVLEAATMANVKAAVTRWSNKGQDPNSILILFYCGHGLGKGQQTTLLLEDFGSLAGTQSLTMAVDFTQMHLGLDQIAARRQCCFIDACRVGTPFALNTLNYLGDPILIPGLRTTTPPRSAPIFYSAIPGTAAFGRTGEPSFFTASLLSAFDGAGADDLSGNWRVDTDQLQRGIYYHLRRSVADTSAAGQHSLVDGLTQPFTLHQLSGDPIVPVDVTCAPDNHNRTAQLNVTGVGTPRTLAAVPRGDWHLDLSLGKYRFDVILPGLPGTPTKDGEVRPPYRRVEVPVP